LPPFPEHFSFEFIPELGIIMLHGEGARYFNRLTEPQRDLFGRKLLEARERSASREPSREELMRREEFIRRLRQSGFGRQPARGRGAEPNDASRRLDSRE
jgi:hypothetical protein